MYRIVKKDSYLMVRFLEDFNYATIRTIIRHETMLPEYVRMNDIWMIGRHHALVSFGDLETITADFQCMCPRNAKHQKTAIVIETGLTEAIVLLWIRESAHRIPFDCRVFHTLMEAEEWIGSSAPKSTLWCSWSSPM